MGRVMHLLSDISTERVSRRTLDAQESTQDDLVRADPHFFLINLKYELVQLLSCMYYFVESSYRVRRSQRGKQSNRVEDSRQALAVLMKAAFTVVDTGCCVPGTADLDNKSALLSDTHSQYMKQA